MCKGPNFDCKCKIVFQKLDIMILFPLERPEDRAYEPTLSLVSNLTFKVEFVSRFSSCVEKSF